MNFTWAQFLSCFKGKYLLVINYHVRGFPFLTSSYPLLTAIIPPAAISPTNLSFAVCIHQSLFRQASNQVRISLFLSISSSRIEWHCGVIFIKSKWAMFHFLATSPLSATGNLQIPMSQWAEIRSRPGNFVIVMLAALTSCHSCAEP